MYQIEINKLEDDFLKLVTSIGSNPNMDDFIFTLNGIINESVEEMYFSSEQLKSTFYYVVGKPTEITRMFTAHYDTVGKQVDREVMWQKDNSLQDPSFAYNKSYPTVLKLENVAVNQHFISSENNDILGADDRAGCLVLAHMIKAGIEGIYMFFPNEESGAGASRALSAEYNTLIKPTYPNIKYAFAFDRKGYGDIINHQSGGKCCSDEFVNALIVNLSNYELFYQSAHGIFTDTANLIYNIPECTNLSVGYFNHHTQLEWINMQFVHKLIQVLCDKLFWQQPLPAVRPLSTRTTYSRQSSIWENDYHEDYYRSYDKNKSNNSYKNKRWSVETCSWVEDKPVENSKLNAIKESNEIHGLVTTTDNSFREALDRTNNQQSRPTYTRKRSEILGTIYSGSSAFKLMAKVYPHKFISNRRVLQEMITFNHSEMKFLLQRMIIDKKNKYIDLITTFTATMEYAINNKIAIKFYCVYDDAKDDFDNFFNEDIFTSNLYL